MKLKFLQHFTLAAPLILALTGCQSAMSTSSTSSAPGSSGGRHSNANVEWPLKFQAHYFGGHCFDTQECEILYRGFPHGEKDAPSPSIASYGRPLEKLLSAGRGPIPNFPEPAKVTWRSMDGKLHEAEIDIGKIFKDQLIRHNVKREEISDEGIGPGGLPAIILEVNDRTINVYMRAHISTKALQKPGNPYSDFREDLVKVFSQTY